MNLVETSMIIESLKGSGFLAHEPINSIWGSVTLKRWMHSDEIHNALEQDGFSQGMYQIKRKANGQGFWIRAVVA